MLKVFPLWWSVIWVIISLGVMFVLKEILSKEQ